MLTFHYATLENLLDWSFFKQTNPKGKPWCGNGVFKCGKVKTNFQCVNPAWEQGKNTRHIFRNMSDLFQNISDIFFIPLKTRQENALFYLAKTGKISRHYPNTVFSTTSPQGALSNAKQYDL